MDIVSSFLLTLLIIFIVPILVYSLFVKYAGLKEPEKKLSFMISILIQKTGTAFGFVSLFVVGREYFVDNWLIYSTIWVVMFAVVEIGQAIEPNYSKKEATAGIISEIIYFPLSAFIISKLIS